MQLWRISRHRDLSGAGGVRAAGRWHFAGRPVVYLAESPAAALLEVCVHTSASDIPPDFTLLQISGPDDSMASLPHRLPHDWRQRLDITRALGTAWLTAAETVLLRVPSALVPETSNYLFNPAHPLAPRFEIVSSVTCPFAPELKR